MICPDCGFDNIRGVDNCEACGQPLAVFDPSGGELEQTISRHPITVLCPNIPLTTTTTASVASAVSTMAEHHVGCLLVLDDSGQLVGIFTERDVLTRVAPQRDQLAQPVGDFMTSSPITIRHDDSIAYALHAMDIGGYRHLPVVDADDHPCGVISIRDILSFLCVRFAELRATS
ncbi:MAG: CBS domain-containing protein [Planctomycetaceae bacterium]|jgi:CBS domain-containing protein|nr:CBS domain-containing protein [Planctomycetaceae bacterium]MDP7278188.1 CBS domain-containing protein [Planctomycetaceae bacterium]